MKWEVAAAAALALAFGALGYAFTGTPGEPSAPAPGHVANPELTPEAEQASKHLMENYGDVRAWLTLTDALIRAERTETAVAALQSGLNAIPGNADLWVQMGIALAAHANGQVVPAARLAFDRAARLDPDHPAPPYFLGLLWLQSGNVDQALAVWEGLRARSPADASWLPMLDERIAMAVRIRQRMAEAQADGGMPGAPGTGEPEMGEPETDNS